MSERSTEGTEQHTDEVYWEMVETWEGNDGKRYRRIETHEGTVIEKAEEGRYVEVPRE